MRRFDHFIRGLCVLSFGLCWAACSDDASQPVAEWRFGERGEPSAPDLGAPEDMPDMSDAPEMASPDLGPIIEPPSVKVFRYRRHCQDTACLQDLQVGLSGATISRLQFGAVTQVETLTPEDYQEILSLVRKPGFIEAMRDDGWSCPEPEELSYFVLLRADIREDGKMNTHIQDLSACYANQGDAPAVDEIVSLSEQLFDRYFRGRR